MRPDTMTFQLHFLSCRHALMEPGQGSMIVSGMLTASLHWCSCQSSANAL
jgi:hypothetical protein